MKIFILSSFLFFAYMAKAQQQPAVTDEFSTFNTNTEAQRYAASQKKEYPTAERVLTEWIDKYDHSPADIRQKYKGYRPGIYYNLACYKALNGKNEEALTAFEKCISMGYSNYKSTMEDSDLFSLHKQKRFIAGVEAMREKSDYSYIISKSGPYNKIVSKDLPRFTYQSYISPELVNLKNKFNLDSISGSGDEISKFKNLLLWTHNMVRHDGNSQNPPLRNAIDLIAVCQKENRGVNCRMMATILRDVYQAKGFTARVVTCMPKDTLDNDCHVITVVWSKKLNKWVWMDPTFNAYVSDTKGNLLNIQEVRERLVNGSTDLVVNPDANWNNKQKETKEQYLDYYMSKNLYWLQCAVKSEWNIETNNPGKAPIEYVNLYPGTFTTLHQSGGSVKTANKYATNNPEYFWQKPASN